MFKNHKLGWPSVALASVAIAAFVAVYLLAPEDRDTIEKAVLAVWGFLATFLGPALRKRASDDDEAGDK